MRHEIVTPGALAVGAIATLSIAIEVETTAKPLEQYLAIPDAYADQGVAASQVRPGDVVTLYTTSISW